MLTPAKPANTSPRVLDRVLITLIPIALCAFPRSAFAIDHAGPPVPTKTECINASERGQQERYEGKLLRARDAFLACANPSCPHLIESDCARWLAEVEQGLPSVVVAASSSQGTDISNANVTVDGMLLEFVSGRAVPVDPGEHRFRVQAAGYLPGEQTTIVREGEKSRVIRVVLTSVLNVGATTPGAASSNPELSAADTGQNRSHNFLGTYILGGAGALGLTGGLILRLSAVDSASCAPNCTNEERDRVVGKYVASNILLGAGGALATGALVWYLVERGTSQRHSGR